MKLFEISRLDAILPKPIKQKVERAKDLQSKGQIEEAIREYLSLLKSLTIYQAKMIIYNQLGLAFFQNGRLDKAIVCFEEALRIARENDDEVSQAKLLTNIGTLYERENRWKQVKEAYSESLKIFEKHGMSNNVKEVSQGMLDIFAVHGKAVSLLSGRGYTENLALSEKFNRLGQLYFNIDDVEKAINYFEQAESAAKNERDAKLLATILNNKAAAYKALHNYALARKCYEQSISVCKEALDLKNLGTTWNNLGILLRETKDDKGALRAFDESLKAKKQAGDSISTATTLFNLAKLHLSLREYKKAREFALKAKQIDEESNSENLKEDEDLLKEINYHISNKK